MPDEAFFRSPLDIGDQVEARWSASDINLLDDGPVALRVRTARSDSATGI